MELNYCDGPLEILKNEISVGNNYGVYVVNSDGGVPPGGTPGLIANNFIHVGSTTTAYGIFLNVSTYQNVYYNSVNRITSYNVCYTKLLRIFLSALCVVFSILLQLRVRR